MVRFSSYSWALVRHGDLPVSHGDARGHGHCAEILMESGDSVPVQRENEPRPKRATRFSPVVAVAGFFHQSHLCQIGDSDQGHSE